jgi:hypothetical protein
MAGFISGEGCFFTNISKSPTKVGARVQLKFTLTQHSRDELLMKSLVSYFRCDSYEPYNNKDFGKFVITKLEDLTEKVIPFFKKYPGSKSLDYYDFKKVLELMKNKAHLTEAGLAKIRKIKAGMNSKR